MHAFASKCVDDGFKGAAISLWAAVVSIFDD